MSDEHLFDKVPPAQLSEPKAPKPPAAGKPEVGDICQISPAFQNRNFRGAFLMVTKVYSWGVQGFVHALDRGESHVRVEWHDLHVIGSAFWLPDHLMANHHPKQELDV